MSKNRNIKINLLIISVLILAYSLVGHFGKNQRVAVEENHTALKLDKVSELKGLVPLSTESSLVHGDLSSVAHDHPVLLRFVATWCQVCKTEQGYVRKIEERFGSRGLRIVEIFSFDKRENVETAVETQKSSQRARYFDSSGDVAKAIGVSGLPQTFVFSKAGDLRYHLAGAIGEDNISELRAVLAGVVDDPTIPDAGEVAMHHRDHSTGHEAGHGVPHTGHSGHGEIHSSSANVSQEHQDDSLPIYGWVPDFALVDSNNRPFKLENLKSKVWVANFIFSSCMSMCPILTRTMGDVRDDLAKSTGGTAHFVSFSVDPSTDTPQKLNEYMKKNSIDGKNWAFLTGTWPHIKRLIEKGFRLGAPDEPKFHTEKFVLVDQKYRIRGYYSASSNQDMARLRRNIGKLLSEKKLM